MNRAKELSLFKLRPQLPLLVASSLQASHKLSPQPRQISLARSADVQSGIDKSQGRQSRPRARFLTVACPSLRSPPHIYGEVQALRNPLCQSNTSRSGHVGAYTTLRRLCRGSDIMPNASSQPEYHPDISDFIEWVHAHSVLGTLGPSPLVNHPFMPHARLETYLKENGRTKKLLHALFPGRDPPIAPEEIWRHCIRVFAILLLIGKGTFIQHFLQHDQLWDSKLPFISDRSFPLTTGDDSFFESFCRKQWHFCPYTFRRDVIDAHLEKEYILPIVSKELLGDGGSASTYKIKLHPAYDLLGACTVNGGVRFALTSYPDALCADKVCIGS